MTSFLSHTFDADSTYPPVHQFHFTDQNDILVKISRAIFEDFKTKISIDDDDFRTILSGFLETCQFAVQSIEKLLETDQKIDANSKAIFNQLSLEQSVYGLLLKLMDSEEAAFKSHKCDSFLTKLFCENVEFRRLLTLLQWSEEIAFRNPAGFSAIVKEIQQFNSVNNIYSVSSMRGKLIHLDCRFDGNIVRGDEDKNSLLNQVLFALLRCGRLLDARRLVKDVGLASIGSFIFLRECLSNPEFTTTDALNENFNLAKSRAFCKQTARDLIPLDNTVSSADQCIWATISSSLPTLLSHATTTEDRLWAYVSCSADTLLEEYLLNVHSKGNENVYLIKDDLLDEDVPRTVNDIFTQIRINESSVYYCLFGYLAVSDWHGATTYIQEYLYTKNDQEIPAHELRFLTHFVLLLKMKNKTENYQLCDVLIWKFSDLLIEMKLYSLVPGYLIHLSADKSRIKMLDFLQSLENPVEQEKVLVLAAEAGYNVSELCNDVYFHLKQKNKIRSDNDETGHSATEMLRAWRWLSYDVETIHTAIIEANYLLRKLLLHRRIAEAMELLRITGEDLPARVEEVYKSDAPDFQKPERILDAQKEYECYILYFEAMNRYNMWQKHIESNSQPELPGKPSDEHWARLDQKRRFDYELSMQKAKECLHKYITLSDSLRKRAMELLENILCMEGGWLSSRCDDEDSMNDEIRERSIDFAKIRNNYFFHIIKCLIELYLKSGESLKILNCATLLVDPRFNVHKSLSKINLQKLLGEISKSGAALIAVR